MVPFISYIMLSPFSSHLLLNKFYPITREKEKRRGHFLDFGLPSSSNQQTYLIVNLQQNLLCCLLKMHITCPFTGLTELVFSQVRLERLYFFKVSPFFSLDLDHHLKPTSWDEVWKGTQASLRG